ncbi:MAG TPA: hypothetical protein VJT72_21765 [Pseudonocardiaceae bacterium]|nr:hypothetical protein [Pseudonocardiaceae bacterium]
MPRHDRSSAGETVRGHLGSGEVDTILAWVVSAEGGFGTTPNLRPRGPDLGPGAVDGALRHTAGHSLAAGHDSFLMEVDQINAVLANALM